MNEKATTKLYGWKSLLAFLVVYLAGRLVTEALGYQPTFGEANAIMITTVCACTAAQFFDSAS